MKIKGVILITVFLVLAAGVAIVKNISNKDDSELASGEGKKAFPIGLNSQTDVTPTKFPFSDLTIPHLRSRHYQSKLGELSKHSENDTYTSYVTSYDSDGLKINGLLTIPNEEAATKYPAIIFIHGYIPPTRYRTTSNYASYVDYLAKRGFVVFKIDLRGHNQSEGDASGAYYAGDYIIDTLNAYSALQNSDFVDPTKIGLWGHSMAGNVVLRSMVVKKDIPAAVIWAGAGYTYSDLQEYSINDNSYQPPEENSERARKRRELAEMYGGFKPDHWFWKQVPGTNYLDGVSGALQLNHATNDDVVSIDYSRNLAKILSPTNIGHELHELPGGGHNISGAYFSVAMENSVSFFEKYLR